MREVTRYDLNEDVATGELFISPVPKSMEGGYVSYEDYAALQQKLDAVLAENVVLKGFIDEDCYTLGEEWSSNGQVTDAAQSVPETPATDALLNAVRAEAIEQAAEKAPWLYGDQMGQSVEAIPKEQLIKWASRLRAETDTTPSQYESLAGGK